MELTLDMVLVETYGLARETEKTREAAARHVESARARRPAGSSPLVASLWKAGEALLRAGLPAEAEPLLADPFATYERHAPGT